MRCLGAGAAAQAVELPGCALGASGAERSEAGPLGTTKEVLGTTKEVLGTTKNLLGITMN